MKFVLLFIVIVVIVAAARMLMSGRRPDANSPRHADTNHLVSPTDPTPTPTPQIKGDDATKTYHTAESPDFDRMPSEVWFESEEAAKIEGFTRWDQIR